MASDVDIVNIGLHSIGEDPVSSLDGTQKRQVVAKGLYDFTRRALLTRIDWRFATHTQALARQAATPTDTRFTYQFSLPSNPRWLKTQRVKPGGRYAIQGNVLLHNSQTALMTYTADVAESIMPPYFVHLLGLYMGVKLAMPLTKQVERKRSAQDDFDDYLPTAMFADASGQPPEPAEDAPFIDCRH